jgi:tRNA threonylcarbamoyladenosine biosynthesis protein TsaB
MTATLALCGSNVTGDVPFSVALAHAGALHEAASPAGGRGDLAQLADEVCRRAGIGPAAIERVVVDLGPGSYTGLRVAVTFARFLLHFGGARAFAVDSLALLAARARPAAGAAPRPVHVLLDARRDRVHVQAFTVAADRVTAQAPAAALPLPAALATLRAGDDVVVPAVTPPAIRDAVRGTGATVREVTLVTAVAMLREPVALTPASAAELEPRYLMASYAES